MTAKFKSTNGTLTGFVPGVGEIVNGILTAPANFQSPNFEKIEETPKTPPTAVPVAPVVSTTPVAPIAQTTSTPTETKETT